MYLKMAVAIAIELKVIWGIMLEFVRKKHSCEYCSSQGNEKIHH